MVADMEELENWDTSEIHARRCEGGAHAEKW